MTFHSHAIHCSHFCATTASPKAYYGLDGYSGLATASGAIYGGASTSLGSSAAAPVYGYNTPQTPPVTAIASALLKKAEFSCFHGLLFISGRATKTSCLNVNTTPRKNLFIHFYLYSWNVCWAPRRPQLERTISTSVRINGQCSLNNHA